MRQFADHSTPLFGLLLFASLLLNACAPSRPAAPETPAVVAPQPGTGNPKPGTDLYGDPLPPGAIARMGKADAWPDNGVTYVAFFPDGKTLISGDNTPKNCTICLWDTATGKPIRMFVTILSFSYALSPDAKTMAWDRTG